MECLKHPQMKRYILPQIGVDIKEMKVIASDAVSIKSAKNFSWKKVITELEAYTPPSRRSFAKGSHPKHRLFWYCKDIPTTRKKLHLLPLAAEI